MSSEYKKGPHTVNEILYRLVWATKYWNHILKSKVALHARELIRQTCKPRNITILSGHVSKDQST